MSADTATRWLAETGCRLGAADQGWYVVIASDGRIVAEAPSVALAVRRAKKALRPRVLA